MKMKSLWLLLLVPVLLVGILGFFKFAPDSAHRILWHSHIAKGDTAIARVRQFQSQTGRIPVALSDTGIAEPENLFYEKCDARRFILWFGAELGESMTYDSRTDAWSVTNMGC